MKAISVDIDNEYFMVKVTAQPDGEVYVEVYSPDQQHRFYKEVVLIYAGQNVAQHYCNDFDKRDAKKCVRRYLKFR